MAFHHKQSSVVESTPFLKDQKEKQAITRFAVNLNPYVEPVFAGILLQCLNPRLLAFALLRARH